MATNSQNSKRVVFIGAAGEMCRFVIDLFVKASTVPLVLADINEAVIEQVASQLPAGRATTRKLDLFDATALRETIQGAELVVLGAGPYSRTSVPVLKACIEAKVPYLDYDDDVESTQGSLELHAQAQRQGIPCYIGCGASPGMTNIMAMDAAQGLDTVDTIDICWWVGDERHIGWGKAVIEHALHIAAGPCLTWENGKSTLHESFVETAYAPVIPEHGESLVRETAHPEPVTLPRVFPNASRIRCLGGIDPIPFQGITRGLGTAVRTNAMSREVAVDFIFNLMSNKSAGEGWKAAFGIWKDQLKGGDATINELLQLTSKTAESLAPWRYSLSGMLDQIREGNLSTTEFLTFLFNSYLGKQVPHRSGILVRVIGTRNGSPVVVSKRSRSNGKDSFLGKSMGAATGASAAAFIVLALDSESQKRGGVFCPEDWVQPKSFYKALERIGCPPNEIVETL